jgi:hypothetical protein
MYTAIFRSPDFPPVSPADERFLPRSTIQAIFYPFWWLVPNASLVGELRMRDWRMAFGYVAWVALVPLLLWRGAAVNRRPFWLLLGVTALSYAIWAKISGIYRYMVLLEALSALLLMAALALGLRGRARPALLVFAMCGAAMIGTTIVPNWGKGRHGEQMLEVPPLPVLPGALVVSLDDEPHSYLVAFMPREVRVLGLNTNILRAGDENGLTLRLRQAIAAHQGAGWSIAAPETREAERDRVLGIYGLMLTGECQLLRTSLRRGGHVFCPIAKR